MVEDNVSTVVWKDKKNVHFVNTYYQFDEITSVKRKQPDGSTIEVCCPACVKGYNINMGLVIRKEKLSPALEKYQVVHGLFWFVVDICVVNAHILEQKSHHHKKCTQKAFRLALGSELLKVVNARKRQHRP